MLRTDQRGRGHGAEAMRQALALIFRGPVARAELVANANNAQATRLAQHVGFDLFRRDGGLAFWHFDRERLALLRALSAMAA